MHRENNIMIFLLNTCNCVAFKERERGRKKEVSEVEVVEGRNYCQSYPAVRTIETFIDFALKLSPSRHDLNAAASYCKSASRDH